MNDEILEFLDREELTLAPKGKRFIAFILDELILSAIWLGVIWEGFSGAETIEDKILLVNSYVFEYMLLKIIYHTFFVLQYGASPGKMLMQVRVVELGENTTPGLRCAFNRAFVRIVSELFFYAGFVWGLLDPMRQTWHDKTARTVVIDA